MPKLAQKFCFIPSQMTVRDALNSALDEEMAADSKVFLMGEEVLVYATRLRVSEVF